MKVVYLLLSYFVISAWGEFFSATSELEKILQVESELASDLRKYISQEEKRLKDLKKTADDFGHHSLEALDDSEKYLGNPVNAFLLVKRFTNDWNHIFEHQINGNNLAELLESVEEKTLRFPSEEDLEGAGKALMRLQDTYAIPPHNFSNGHLFSHISQHPVSLNSEDCFKLGTIAYASQDYYHTILWMSEVLRVQASKPTPKDIQTSLVLDYLSFSYYMQGNLHKALNLTQDLLELEPQHIRAQDNYAFFKQLIIEQDGHSTTQPSSTTPIDPDSNPRPLDAYKRSADFVNYEKLCRGEKTHANTEDYRLHCFNMRHHPFLLLQPLKAEEVHWSPRMFLLHDVMTPSQVDAIKVVAKSKLGRSVVYHKSDSSSTTAQDYRVSKSAWLKDGEARAAKQFSFISSTFANLTLHTVEDLQVLNYGIGGHYEPHYDFSIVEMDAFDKAVGNRVATFICYLSDVEAGGATVFPGIGVSYWPRKGKCAFWYNLQRSGEGDMRTRHAACPVLSGIKWACNKWFHERGQEFIRPCLTSPLI